MKDMDFEAARIHADERLNQELLRIRNLPKRSKIKIANKYGLKHASHTNAGLLKELEINLNVISREQKRVTNELNKRQRAFTETQKKSLSKVLPPLPKEDTGVLKKQKRRTLVGQEQPPVWLYGRKESVNQVRRELLIELTARSKQKTCKIIADNNKKISIGPVLPPIQDEDIGNSWVTRLNRQRVNTFGRSCFPSLLENQSVGEQSKTRRKLPSIVQQNSHKNITEAGDLTADKTRTFRGTVYEKVLKMPDPANIPHLNPRDPKLYHVVMKVTKNRKTSKLEKSDAVIAKTNSVFTKHWN